MSNWISWIYPFPPKNNVDTGVDEDVPPTLKEGDMKEFPCFQCQRTNDSGVKTCWWCGVDYPTKKS